MSNISTSEYQKGLPPLSSSNLFAHLSILARLGVRWAGTRMEEETVKYIDGELAKIGLKDVAHEDFEYLNYAPKSAHLAVRSPVSVNIPCKPLQYTANAEVEGEMVYAGQGSRADFDALAKLGVNFSGKIVVIRSHTPFWVTPIVEELGGSGLVVITDAPEGLIRNLTGKLYPPPLRPPFESHICKFPGVVTNTEGGEKILLLSQQRVRLKIGHQASYSTKRSVNIIATQRGSELKDELVVLGAHYDTQLEGGVNDDATGVSGVLEMARIFAGLHPRRSITFAFFANEEIGLWGSSAYVDAHKDKLGKNCVCMINLDSVSSKLCVKNLLWGAPRSFTDFALGVAGRLGWEVSAVEDLAPLTWVDAAPFIVEVGVPAMQAFEWVPFDPYYHTKGDRIENIDPIKMARTLTVSAECAFQAAYQEKLTW